MKLADLMTKKPAAPTKATETKAKRCQPRPAADERLLSSAVDIVSHMSRGGLFARWFKKTETWAAWLAFLKAVFGLGLSADERAIYTQCTARTDLPVEGFTEAWLCVGRRGGKSLVLALIATYLAAVLDWSPYLTGGERGTVMIVAADRRQARTIFRYVTALLKDTALSKLIERETADALDLSNGVTIEILTASFRTVRGYTLIAALLDELAFWRSDENTANPDKEVVAAIRPAMATVPGAMLLCASSPYARRGTLFDTHQRHFGKAGDPILVWQAATKVMNPTVPDRVITEAYADDPARAAAEYGAQFRIDVETFVAREVVEACTVRGRHELSPLAQRQYFGFCDPSGGSADSMTLAIAHRDEWSGKTVLNAAREIKPPFSPDAVVTEFAGLLKSYGITRVVGDRYAGEWPRDRFRFYGITYVPSEKAKSELYLNLLPLLNSNTAELLDLPRVHSQLVGLERHTSRAGRDTIDHAPNAHDDLANAVAGALVLAAGESQKVVFSVAIDDGVFSSDGSVIAPERGDPWPRVVRQNELPPERLWPNGDNFLR